eukprot:4941811-Pyramimonas_sp.AAC.1
MSVVQHTVLTPSSPSDTYCSRAPPAVNARKGMRMPQRQMHYVPHYVLRSGAPSGPFSIGITT